MTAPDFRRRLTDVPANSRPWTSDWQARSAAGSDVWYNFWPGETVRCPSCSQALTTFGSDQGCSVRIHPDQRRDPVTRDPAGPSSVRGEARTCRCKKHLDMRFLPVAKAPATERAS